MFVHARSRKRPYHLGPFPLETLPRDVAVVEHEGRRPRLDAVAKRAMAQGPLARAVARYHEIFAAFADGEPAPAMAPVPDDRARRAIDVKGAAYFMDASQVGICLIPASAWFDRSELTEHDHGVVILVEHARVPERANPAHAWIAPAVTVTAELRALEIAACVAGHLRWMGLQARVHVSDASLLDVDRLAVLAGLAVRREEALVNPYLGVDFSIAVISTNYSLQTDLPLAASTLHATGLRYWWGANGAMSGRERQRRARRQSHLSRYPMETVRRVDRPTTLILDEEVPRVSPRAAFFERALHGDLGPKSQRERGRFAFKHPYSRGQLELIRALVPFQDGEPAVADRQRYPDPEANARAIKSLSYFLGSDLTGICEIPRYAWNSHRPDGTPLEPYHRYAVVMLIDQGYDTMEGASGDDWICGAQSMRGYLRGAEIAGLMAELLRSLGFPARPQTNADSDVQQIPLILMAGLGELSRIGELVLNPFVGPRFKSVVLTTDLPLAVDRPIDFGLQYFCEHCFKCARECPCDAISLGDKVMFNGYEMWKPDVERCARYRLTNARGSACGRCMKTCPLNKVVDLDGPLITRAASWLGINAMWLKPLLVPVAAWLDDRLGNGRRNPAKKWWFDHEVRDGVTVAARASNERDIDPAKSVDPARQTIAYFHADMMPPPDAAGPVAVDRRRGLEAAAVVESPSAARARIARGGATPGHYAATPAAGDRQEHVVRVNSPYAGGEGARAK